MNIKSCDFCKIHTRTATAHFRNNNDYTAVMICNSIIWYLNLSKHLNDLNVDDDDNDNDDADDDDTQLGVKCLQN